MPIPCWAPQSLSALSMRGSTSATPQPINLLYTNRGEAGAACAEGGTEGLQGQSWQVSSTGTVPAGVQHGDSGLGLQLLAPGAR